MSHPPDVETTRRVALVGAELGLLALAMGTAASFTRLFVEWSWLGQLALVVVVAWALSIVLRRLGAGLVAATAAHLFAAAFVLSWVVAPGTVAVVLPTPETASQLTGEVSDSFGTFSDLVAPVEATPGFLVVIAACLWLLVAFADTAALRFAAPVQAAVPYVATFAAVGILARSSGRVTAAIAFCAGLGCFALTQRALAASSRRWVGGRTAQGARATLLGGGVVAVVAVVAGLVVAPLLPGTTQPVVDLRTLGDGNGPRTVVSPFVGLRSLLGERSDQVMFSVTADAPAYWRLTALETYDPEREIWTSRTSYQPAQGALNPDVAAGLGGTPVRQQFRIDGLNSVWLPAAYAPREVDSDVELSFDSQSSSLILQDRSEAFGLEYSLDSVAPDIAAALVESTTTEVPDVEASYLEAPTLDAETRALRDQVVSGATTPYEQMIALQNWFRSAFTYSDEVDYSQSPDALATFLTAKEGFCQQFSSAFAIFARSLGLPSRVAVGFTPGDPVEQGPDGSVEYVVRGRHAHAWPEVYFDDVGWVPFEPTPQRGNPQAVEHTGVQPEQAEPPAEQAATTTQPTVAPPTQPTTPTSTPDQVAATADEPEEPESGPGQGFPWQVLVVVALLLALGSGAVVLVRRARRRSGTDRQARNAIVADAWQDAVRAVAAIGLRPDAAETPVEFARRVDAQLHERVVEPLAVAETRRRFGLGTPSPAACDAARASADRVVEHVRSVTTRRQRVGTRIGR
jgi:transglutaminase-like putative cysteine protease